MAKALKTIGTIVAVVAIVAGAIALTIGTGGTFLGVAAATFGTVATAAGLAAATISLTSALVLKPPGFSSSGNPQKFVTNPQSALPYNIGRTRMSGIRIHAETTDGFSDKTQNDVLGFAVLLSAGGPIESIDSFEADRASLASYGGFMSLANSLGGSTALSLSLGTGSMPGWTADHKLTGMAHALWMLRFDPKGEQFQGGVPEPAWVGKWSKVYDPRLDSTYPGGSGTHRALDESTYTWSRNPALHALTWCLGRWQNGKRILGIGAPIANIRVSEFVEAANIADANDWTCGGTLWSADSKWGNLKSILQACGSVPTMTGAMIGCLTNSPKVSLTTVTKDHLLDSLKISVTKSRRDKFNSVIPRYRSEAHNWEIISGSPISSSTYQAQDGGVKSVEVDFALVQHELVDSIDGQSQVGQLAAYEMVNSREAGPIEFTLPPQFIGLKSGDCITIDVPEEGIASQTVILRSVSLDPASAKITCIAETETFAKHAFALGKTTTPPPPFTLTPPSLTPDAPSPLLWDAVASLTADGLPQIVVSGSSEYTIGVDVLIRHRKTGDTDWFAPVVLVDPRGTVIHQILPLESLTSYDVEVAYRNGALISSWLALGPETTGDGTIGAPGPPGEDGVSTYVHIAYATNSTGTSGFSTTDGVGKTYIGTYTDTTPADSTDPALYTWSLIKGADGTSGINAITGYLTKETVQLFSYANGGVVSYAPASGSFKVFSGNTDVSSSFTLSTLSNPQALTVGYSTQTYSVTAGFDVGEDTASLTIRATGSGAYAGVTIDKVFSLSKSKGGYEIVATLPTTNLFEGRIVFLTTDDKLYRYNGTAWTKAVDGADIQALSVTTNALAVGSVTAAKIGVTELSAITAVIGTLRTATTGARTEIKDNLIEIFDASNVKRVRLGVWA